MPCLVCACAGFDPARLSPAELQQRLPDVFGALLQELSATSRQLVTVQKSADQIGRQVPNPGLEREERIVCIAESSPDPNAVLDNVFPLLGE
jgi:hypothetical protein